MTGVQTCALPIYALYNDGKTGLINKVDQLIENQQAIKIDVEILKSKAES